jgi:hypothetical protein
MKLMRSIRLALVLAGVLLSSSVFAQTTQTAQWDYIGPAPAVVATYTQTVSLNGVVVVTAPTCVAKPAPNPGTTCQVAIPALVTGPNILEVTAALNGQTRTIRMTGLSLSNGPTEPSGGRIAITVIINVGS